MNRFKITFCALLLLTAGSKYLRAQEEKNSISVGGTAAHYFGIHDFGKPKTEDSYHFPVSPGAQIIYWRQITGSVQLGTGLNYQKVHHQSKLDTETPFYGYSLKFDYKEVSIPLLLKKSLLTYNQNHWYITLGAYTGRQRNIKLQSPNSAGWQPWEENTQVGGYSKDLFFTDLYLNTGYAFQLGSSGEVSLAPFYKYRVNSTWVNTYLKKSIVGINLNYSFKF